VSVKKGVKILKDTPKSHQTTAVLPKKQKPPAHAAKHGLPPANLKKPPGLPPGISSHSSKRTLGLDLATPALRQKKTPRRMAALDLEGSTPEAIRLAHLARAKQGKVKWQSKEAIDADYLQQLINS